MLLIFVAYIANIPQPKTYLPTLGTATLSEKLKVYSRAALDPKITFPEKLIPWKTVLQKMSKTVKSENELKE